MNVSLKSQIDDEIKLIFKGKNVNNVTVNTLRRVILSEVPTYSITHDTIDIEKNTTVFNNDYVKQRLCFIPLLPNISNKITLLDENTKDKLEADLIDIYIEKENNTTNEMCVTTNDMNFSCINICSKNKIGKSPHVKAVNKTPIK